MRDDQFLHLSNPKPILPTAGGPYLSRVWQPPTRKWGWVDKKGPPVHPHPIGFIRVGHNPRSKH